MIRAILAVVKTDFVLPLQSHAGGPLPPVASRETARLRIGLLPGPSDLDYYAGRAGTIDLLREANFAELPLEALEPLARDLEQTARALRLRAAEVRTRRRRWRVTERRLDAVAATPGAVQRKLDAGLSLEEAIAATARSSGFPADSIAGVWQKHLREEKKAARLRRDLEILKMARAGKTNDEIAASLQPALHPGSVSRILRRLITDAYAHAAARGQGVAEAAK